MHRYIKNILFISFVLFTTKLGAQAPVKQLLNTNWKFRNAKQTSWTDIQVPTNVHTELIKRKLIPNPFWGNNERLCAWVENENWVFSNYFDADFYISNKKKVRLVFEGLDTYCKIKLNGNLIAEANNMHRTWAVDVTKYLMKTNNLLLLEFTSPQKVTDSLATSSAQKMPTDSRVYARKASYQYSWDFAPKLLSIGIYKPVYLLAGNDDFSEYPTFSIVEPIAKFDAQKFQFSINGKPIFAKGINMVPPSSLLPVSNKYYETIIENCKNLNINLIRIWGGGVYPPEYFYELCDKNNIMVWQDFMFANAMLPNETSFKNNILAEVEDAIRKLRHHKCIVLWCGNNEISEGWQNWGWQKNYSGEEGAKLWQDYLQFFEVEIPQLVKLWDDARPYISTSPKNGWGKPSSMTDGDSHYWGVWWGKEPIANYWYKIPRFMSEYGMQGMPDIHSVLQFCEPQQMILTDSNFTNHQKHPTGFETIRHYMQNYPELRDSLSYIYFSQLVQRDALKTAISGHRSAYPYCNGSMPWQLNDVWPAISWSIIDYFNRPKASYYSIKKLFAKDALTLGKFISKNDANILDTSKHVFALSICEPSYDIGNLKTKFTVYDFYGDAIYETDKIDWQIGEGGNYYTSSFFEKTNFNTFNWSLNYLQVSIKNKDGLDIQENFYFADSKKLKLQSTSYETVWLDEQTFSVESLHLAKDVYLYCTNPDVKFSDNYFDLRPGQKHKIIVEGFNKDKDSIHIYSQVDMAYE